MLENFLFAPEYSFGDGTVPGIVPTPPPPFELENEIDLEGNWDRRPPVNETERERVKRRLKF